MSDFPNRHSPKAQTSSPSSFIGEPESLITDHLDIWTAAIKTKSAAGRGSSKKLELVGIKKLRELILELAVRGKLVPQDPNDEPASKLLKKIEVEKARLVKEGKIKKQKPLSSITEEDKPFELPSGWEFTKFGNLYSLEYGNNLPQPKRSGTGEYSVFGSNGVVGSHKECCISEPCIVVGRKGSAGALNLCTDIGCWVTDVAYSVVPPNSLSIQFVYKQFHTLGLDILGKGIKPGLNRNDAYILAVAIPPIKEQHRIVTKVDELMALCDQLEAQTESSIDAHKTLVEVLLATLTDAKDADELNDNWQTISQHFDVLFTTQASIDQLKQTILQLAVMGKLVKQDPKDEPASKLLERIATEKQQLIKDGKIKKQKPLPPITDEEKPFGLPDGWDWAKLRVITTGMDSGWSPACLANSSPSEEVWGVLKTTAVQVMEYLEFENKELPEKLKPRPVAEVKTGDILFTRAGPMNRVGISCLVQNTRPKLMISDKIIRFHPMEIGIYGRFIALCLNAGATAAYLEDAKSGMAASQVNITQEKLAAAPIPLAPLAQQHRIVTKVDELMALCDSLKERLNQAQTTQLQLTDAIVEQAL
jgi:type I restriction enzyme S subunit